MGGHCDYAVHIIITTITTIIITTFMHGFYQVTHSRQFSHPAEMFGHESAPVRWTSLEPAYDMALDFVVVCLSSHSSLITLDPSTTAASRV